MNESQIFQVEAIQKLQETQYIKIQNMEAHLNKFDHFQTSLNSLELQLQA